MNDGMPRKGVVLFDILVIIILVLAALASIILRKTDAHNNGTAVVILAEKTESRYPIDKDQVLEIESCGYSYSVVIENGSVSVSKSDCDDLTCVHSGRISSVGGSIVCLPGHLIISIEGGNADDSDFIAGQ